MNPRLGPITIDLETADRITLLNLQDYRQFLQDQLDSYFTDPRGDENPNGVWLHPDDVVENTKAVSALDIIISHFNHESSL